MAGEGNAQAVEQKTPQTGGEGGEGGEKATPPAGSAGGPDQPTVETIKGMLAQVTKNLQREVSKSNEATLELLREQKEQIELQKTALENLRATPPKPEKGKEGEKVDSAEVIELRRKLDLLTDANSKAQQKAEAAEERERKTTRKTLIMDALSRAKCTKPEVVFRAINPDVNFDPENKKVTATVPSGYGGDEELDIDTYVTREVREKQLPELFEGTMRAGSPAGVGGGDVGGEDSPFDFTVEQAFDPEFYDKNSDAVNKSLEAGRIKGVKSPVPGK
jgi:hypothetical protein